MKTTFCERCFALRWIEDWRETRHETLLILLGPCHHVIERCARLRWGIPPWGAQARAVRTSGRAP